MSALTLPGFANVHSHAFQRRLRGIVQRRDPDREDTFWSWRETMYQEALRLDLAAIEASARHCYAECLEAGFTAVGEFHYLHHRPDGLPWDDPVAAARAHLRAARQTGIRLTLLWCVYARGGIGKALQPRQRRFATAGPDQVWDAIERLSAECDGQKTRLGLALHSVRAVPRDWIGPLAEQARARAMPIHAHVSEQASEVQSCRQAHGLSPVGLLAAEGALGDDFTAIHATWLDENDIELLAASGASVGLCPSTECDLGDGVPQTRALFDAGVPLAIGSDSHALIDPFAELRLAEYLARASTGTRCVLVDAQGHVAGALARIGHHNGYRTLGLAADGDVITVDGNARALGGTSDPMAALLIGGHPGLIRKVEVAGEAVVEDGRHVAVGTIP